MSASEPNLQLYEAVGDLTDRMLAAARDGEWDLLAVLEQQCSALVAQLPAADSAPLAHGSRTRKVHLIQKILADDRAIRDLVTPWMAELAARMNSTSTSRKLTATYASA